MFQITMMPLWSFALMLFLISVGVLTPVIVADIVTSRRKSAVSGNWDTWILISGVMITLVFMSVGIWAGLIDKNITTDNPLHFESSNSGANKAAYYYVDQSGFEKVLQNETGIENISIDSSKNNAKKTFEHLQQGEFISFEGIKGDSRIEGSVYFSKDSMVILMDENDSENKIVVPTK